MPMELDFREKMPDKLKMGLVWESVFEVRFDTSSDWALLPGQVFQLVKERYPKLNRLGLSSLPENLRKQNPDLNLKPHLEMLGETFVLRLGPQVISLSTQPGVPYPGWARIEAELDWLFASDRLSTVTERITRVGVRYINFFEGKNPFEVLQTQLTLQERSLEASEVTLVFLLRSENFKIRFVVDNTAEVNSRQGGVFDIDAFLDLPDGSNCLEFFRTGHAVVKRHFFSLLRDEYLSTIV